MNLKALIARFRVLANDKAEPYFWRDEEVSGWLNDAVHEACLRGRLLHSDDAFVTDVEKGRPLYAYATGEFAAGYVYEIDSIRFVSDGKPVCLKLVSPETADVCAPGWRDGAATGLPVYAVQGDEKLTLAPAPDRNGRLFVGGYCLPRDMEEDEDAPEINSIHHRNLVYWALAEAFSIPDTETFDPQRSESARRRFELYFGLSTDSDLRRITREDTLHLNRHFWI